MENNLDKLLNVYDINIQQQLNENCVILLQITRIRTLSDTGMKLTNNNYLLNEKINNKQSC